MASKEEKLSLLAELIRFARSDENLKESEYLFLLGVARQLGVDEKSFDQLFYSKPKKVVPTREADRIVQFHRLVLLMNVDREQNRSEITQLYNIGVRLGLPPSAIDQVLEVMHQYPNKIIPPEVLINIFKAHHN